MKTCAGPIAAIFDLNTDLVLNCVADVDDAAATRRSHSGGNSIAYLLAHLIDCRYVAADLLGSATVNPLAPLLADARSIEEVATLPLLAELVREWVDVSAELKRRLSAATDEDLARPTLQSYPIAGGTVGDALAFLAQHDTYHLGQIALLRRAFGLPAMTYARR